MDNKELVNDIGKIIKSFQESMKAHLPALKDEVNTLIETKCNQSNTIEYVLDTLLSLTIHGVADDLFIRLLEYYKTVDTEGATFYWKEYDEQE